jgi:hypothetical protein
MSSSRSRKVVTVAIEPGDKILFMKVGMHAGEELPSIIARKRAEIEAEGFALWGYGGSTCHPRTMVQPFAAAAAGPIVLAMQPMPSKHARPPVRADEYSKDGVTWTPVPPAINCVGSRYALIIDSLDEVDDVVDLAQTRVALGPSMGKAGASYVQGRADKACLEVTEQLSGETRVVNIGLRATLLEPFAVFLRN